jgi:hypothetical protein
MAVATAAVAPARTTAMVEKCIVIVEGGFDMFF